jgi:hypothetical protein
MIFARVATRAAFLGAAAACLLLAPGHAPAQAPRADDTDKRLRAIEDKLEQIRSDTAPRVMALDPKAAEKLAQLLAAAKDRLENQIEVNQQRYQDFRLKAPFPLSRNANGPTYYQARLGKIDSRRQELQQRQAEIETQAALLKEALAKPPADAERDARALLLLLQRRGVDVAAMRRAAEGRGEIGAADLLRLYADSLQFELKEVRLMTEATEKQRDQAIEGLRMLSNYEVTEEQYRKAIQDSRQLFETIVKRLSEINLVRELKP